MRTNVSNNKTLFLIDTEAGVSVIKFSSINTQTNIDKNDVIKLTGITSQPIFSLGSFNLQLIHGNDILKHKFHTVADDFPIPSNGIIGKDFIKRFKCLIDYGEMQLTIRKVDSNQGGR